MGRPKLVRERASGTTTGPENKSATNSGTTNTGTTTGSTNSGTTNTGTTTGSTNAGTTTGSTNTGTTNTGTTTGSTSAGTTSSGTTTSGTGLTPAEQAVHRRGQQKLLTSTAATHEGRRHAHWVFAAGCPKQSSQQCTPTFYGQWIVDDAGLTFAYARSLSTGAGPVLQPGAAPVEGFSSPAYG